MRTRSLFKQVQQEDQMAFISQTEPKDIHEALKHESWINAMQEELEQIKKNQVWTLISRPVDQNIVGTDRYLRTS